MKKLFLLLLIMPLFFSCGKSSGSAEPDVSSYVLVNNLKFKVGDTYVDYIIYECNSKGEKIASHQISKMAYGASQSFNANPMAEKIKVYMTYYGSSSPYIYKYWVQNLFYLSKGKTITITITNDTAKGENEP